MRPSRAARATCAVLVAGSFVATSARRAEANIFSDAVDWVKGLFSSPPPGVRRTAKLRFLYSTKDGRAKDLEGTFPVQDLRVGIFTKRSILGTPEIQQAARTNAKGEVTLACTLRPGEVVHLRIETDSPGLKTFPGKWNLFVTPHELDIVFSAAESSKDLDRDLWWGKADPKWNLVLGVHDAAVRSRAYGERLFEPAVAGVTKKVSVSYPEWISNGTSYTPLPDRIVIVDTEWHRSHTTVFHEVGHTFWYHARGGLWNEALGWLQGLNFHFKHSLTEEAATAELAMAEGFADWYSILAKDDFGRATGHEKLANHQVSWFGEDHRGREHPEIAFAKWGERNESNVACALWDLADTHADELGLLPGYRDRAGSGTLEKGSQGLLAAVQRWSKRTSKRPSLTELYRADLSELGRAGEDALRMNGIRY